MSIRGQRKAEEEGKKPSKEKTEERPDEKTFSFWMEFFIATQNEEITGGMFPVSALPLPLPHKLSVSFPYHMYCHRFY